MIARRWLIHPAAIGLLAGLLLATPLAINGLTPSEDVEAEAEAVDEASEAVDQALRQATSQTKP